MSGTSTPSGVSDTADAVDRGPRDGEGFRDWLRRLADVYDVSTSDVRLLSRNRDPFWMGTDGHHAKAEWFADLWRQSVAGRVEETIHIRGVHYFAVSLDEAVAPPGSCSWDAYKNEKTCFNYLADAAVVARVLGYVPLGGITDEKNTEKAVTRYGEHDTGTPTLSPSFENGVRVPNVPTVDDRASVKFGDEGYVEHAVENWSGAKPSFDRPSQQPFHVEVWSEKTLPDEIKRVLRSQSVNTVVEGEGHLSYTVANDFARRANAAEKPAVVLYLADYDPSGDDMPAAMAGKLEWLKQEGKLDHRAILDRLAITERQIEEFDLPLNFDKRDKGEVELNALEANLDNFKQIVREGADPLTDDSLGERNENAIEEWQEEADAAVRKAIGDTDITDSEDTIEEWAGEFNEALDDAEDALTRLDELTRDDRLSEWKQSVRSAERTANIPSSGVPDGEGDPPDDPLYDSSRTYPETLDRANGGNIGGKK
jgi:hypothetical protein